MSAGKPVAAPILIVGAPRSGTTLLATMLNAHPGVYVANESKLIIDFLPHGATDIEETAGRLARAAEERGLRGAPDPETLLDRAPTRDVPGLLRALFEAESRERGKPRWGEKTAVAYRRLPAIRRAFPDARFIGLHRPLAKVAASYARINPQWGAAGGLLHWLDFRRAIAREGPDFPFLMVSYSDLVADTRSALEEVCGFLDIAFDPAMLEHHTTERARDLAAAPEFAGAAEPVYRRQEGEETGLPDWLIRSAEAYAARLDERRRDLRPPLWEPPLRAWVYARLVAREALAGGPGETIRKVARALGR